MKGREGCCIFVDLGRFPLTRREIPLEGWFLFFFRRSGWINGADIVYIYIYMDEIDLLQVFLFKRNETFGKEKF